MGRKLIPDDIKLEIVEKYLNDGGVSLNELSKQYHVCMGDIQKWRDLYLEHGPQGLVSSSTNNKYTGEFKVAVVEYMKRTGTSIRKTAARYGIRSYVSVIQWERIYYTEGKEALLKERRGRPGMKAKSKNKKRKQPPIDQNKDLLEEVQRLRMENEYLKKLYALVQKREQSDKKTE